MKYIKKIRQFGNSVNCVTFKKDELAFEQMAVGDFIQISIEGVKKKAYICNKCQQDTCLLQGELIASSTDDTVIICENCGNDQRVRDSITKAEWNNK